MHLEELELEVPYITKKGTYLVRQSPNQIQLDGTSFLLLGLTVTGGKILIPIFKKGETYATCRNVSQYCMVLFILTRSNRYFRKENYHIRPFSSLLRTG